MPTLKDLIESQATSVFLNTDHFARTVTHRPLGNSANDVARTANVVWLESDQNADGGKGQRVRGSLDLSASVSVAESDQWIIDGTVYQTTLLDEPDGGLRRVHFQRTTAEQRTRAKGVL